MLGSFLIFLREGIEGSMIVTIMCTYLASAGRRDLFRYIYLGVGAAIVAAGAAGVGLYALSREAFINSRAQTLFETATFLVAVAVLTYMTFWMKRNSRGLGTSLREGMNPAVAGGSAFALTGMAFVTVGRESLETAVFLVALAFQSSPAALLIGAIVGLAVAVAISIGMYRLGIKLHIGRFFLVMGVALIVVAAGLLANAVQNLQELGVLPGANILLWNTSAVLPDDQGLGDVLHGLIGYSAVPSVLQGLAYIAFLVVAGLAFLGAPRPIIPAGRRRASA